MTTVNTYLIHLTVEGATPLDDDTFDMIAVTARDAMQAAMPEYEVYVSWEAV